MPRHLPPIEDTLSGELFDNFLDFVEQEGAIPIERAFWGWLIRTNRYDSQSLTENTFRYYFDRLVREHWIGIEPHTRSLRPLRGVKITVDRP